MMNNDGVVNGVDWKDGDKRLGCRKDGDSWLGCSKVVDDVVIEDELKEIEKPLPSSYAGEGEKEWETI